MAGGWRLKQNREKSWVGQVAAPPSQREGWRNCRKFGIIIEKVFISTFMSNSLSSTGIPAIPAKRSGAEIYNSIMRGIEPELTTDQIPLMKEQYRNETPAQKKQRGERDAKAMEEYERRYAAHLQEQDASVRSFKVGAIRFVEQKASESDQQKPQSIETSFGTL